MLYIILCMYVGGLFKILPLLEDLPLKIGYKLRSTCFCIQSMFCVYVHYYIFRMKKIYRHFVVMSTAYRLPNFYKWFSVFEPSNGNTLCGIFRKIFIVCGKFRIDFENVLKCLVDLNEKCRTFRKIQKKWLVISVFFFNSY